MCTISRLKECAMDFMKWKDVRFKNHIILLKEENSKQLIPQTKKVECSNQNLTIKN